MERDCKRKKTKNRESLEERSPPQHMNGLHRRNTKKSSHISSSSAPAASRSLLSDNNTSSSTSFSYSSRTHIHKKQNRFPKIAKNESNKSRVRTSNETPRKPFLQTSRKEKPRFITQSDAKPTCKNRQRLKLSPVQDKSEKVSEEFQKKMKISDDNGSGNCTFGLNIVSNGSSSNCAEFCTPHSLNFGDYESAIDDVVYEGGDAANDVKTPPVEASLSPEIQCQSQSRMLVFKSVGTPVCYGAGHLVSGVSDRRKSKRRGSLKGGPEKGNLFSDEDVSVNLQESSIPLIAEASVRWHLFPCDLGNRLGQYRMVYDDDSGTVNSLSLPSILCGNTLDFLRGKSSYSGSGGVRNVAIDRRNSDAISPIKATVHTRILEPLRCNMDESLGSLNSGNVIQTPDSDSSSDTCFGRSRLEVHLSNSFWPELDSITEMPEGVKLSPRNEVKMWGGLGSHSVDICSPLVSLDPTRVQKNVNSVSTWVSDTTNDNLTLSQMSISWCEGLTSEIVEPDEFDCCCCLSDEEIIDRDEFSGEQLTKVAEEKESDRTNNSGRMVVASVENKDVGFRIGNQLSPVILDFEPCLPAEGKGKSFSIGTNACAESICTDGGGLLASDDSDWSFFQESRSFRVTYSSKKESEVANPR